MANQQASLAMGLLADTRVHLRGDAATGWKNYARRCVKKKAALAASALANWNNWTTGSHSDQVIAVIVACR